MRAFSAGICLLKTVIDPLSITDLHDSTEATVMKRYSPCVLSDLNFLKDRTSILFSVSITFVKVDSEFEKMSLD